jgi:PKD repeat protein
MMCHLYCTHIMRVSSRLLVSQAMTKELTAVAVAAVAIAIILLAANITITNAQQQQLTNQPAVIQNGTTTSFQSTEDGIRLNVPEGWVIHDVNNTGSALLEESTQGYGILAQLCPQEEQQQQQQQEVASSNVSGSNDASSCQGSEGDIIHMVRYPDLDTRLQAANNVTTTTPATNNNNMTTIDNILSYHMQKLQEVGYSGIEIVDSTDTTVNVTNAQTDQTIAIVPAKNVEITYSTASAPNQTRTGYFILTATDATPPSLGIRKGYSIFYEGNSDTTNAETTRPSGSLAPTPLPATVRQVFDSFELVAAVVVPTVPLTAEITSSDDEEGEVAPATFEFEVDVIGGTEPYTISWDLDDDGIGESNEQTLVVTFEEAGSYNVGLTVTDSSGQSASDSMEITVEEEEVEAVEEEEEEEEEVEENNNADSNDLIDADEIIDDVFDRLGIR